MDARINDLLLDIEEVKALEGSAQREGVKSKLAVIKSQFEQEVVKLRSQQTESSSSATAKPAPKTKVFTKRITTYAWDQSEKFIKIYVSGLNGVSKEDVAINYDGNHYILNVSNLNKSNYQFIVPKLLNDVLDPTLKIKTDEVVIMFKKASAGKWDTLSAKEKQEKEEKAKQDDLKFDKSSSDPSKGIMDLMKKMYDDGDDEMKRTIAKAWTESREKQMAGDTGF